VSNKKDFIVLELDKKRDLHMTLVYKKQIRNNIDLMACLKLVIHLLNTYPELVTMYANLSYFGNQQTKYWYDVPESFPFRIEIPASYTVTDEKPNYDALKVASGGSIINESGL